ncbi:hypothetical protein KM043_000838 [Ampulex compressa]|nr:hypothetical protein KM043_000838 [Ampulex compressa]
MIRRWGRGSVERLGTTSKSLSGENSPPGLRQAISFRVSSWRVCGHPFVTGKGLDAAGYRAARSFLMMSKQPLMGTLFPPNHRPLRRKRILSYGQSGSLCEESITELPVTA